MEWLKHSGIAFIQAGGATALIMAFVPKEYWPTVFVLLAAFLKMRGIQIPTPGGVDASIARGDPAPAQAKVMMTYLEGKDASKNPFRR